VKNLLFLGDYFPHFSYTALSNHSLTKRFHAMGFNIFYLSTSWCDVDNYSFVKPVIHNQYDHIKECYYADPIQVEYSNVEISLIALARSIISLKKIDFVYVSDIQKYGITAELIGNHFGIPIVVGLFSDDSFFHLYEQYTKHWFEGFSSKITSLYTHDCRTYMYKKYSKCIDIYSAFPYEYHAVYKKSQQDSIVIMGSPTQVATVKRLVRQVVDMSSNINVKLLIWGVLRDAIYEAIPCENISRVECFDFELGVDIFDHCQGMLAIDIDTLLNVTAMTYDRRISIDKTFMLLSYGLYPLVATNSVTYDAITNCYSPLFFQYDKAMSALTMIDINDESSFKFSLNTN